MKIAWIYPLNRRCGIGFYAKKYCAALRSYVDIVEVDSADFVLQPHATAAAVNACDAAHLQYETSLYMQGRRDNYRRLCNAIAKPLIVSLHEVYRKFPGVFSRDDIGGSGAIAWLRRLKYDLLHPALTALAQHERAGFHAKIVLVHAHFQRRILIERGMNEEMVRVIPHPIALSCHDSPSAKDSMEKTVRLGSVGFINVNYDYKLLLESLAALSRPWTFVWIGGLRKPDDQPLLEWLLNEVRSRGWADRFRITGWVDDSELHRSLVKIDIYCALFKNRSSSESLATAMGALKPIVATRLPLTEELNEGEELMAVVDPSPSLVVAAINRLVNDHVYRKVLSSHLQSYAAAANFTTMARRLYELYAEIIGRSP